MAKLTALPHQSIIDGFKGTLDFYVWRGIPCVRSWPRKPLLPRSPAVQRTAAVFGYLATFFTDTPANIRDRASAIGDGTSWTWRDVRYRAAYGNLIEASAPCG